jgi:hypothetical protein
MTHPMVPAGTDIERKADLAESLVPVAARLVGSVRDDGPVDVAMILSGIPGDHLPALAVVLAAMVDPERTPGQLLAWTQPDYVPPKRTGRKPYPREHGTDRGYHQHRERDDMPACDSCLTAHNAANEQRAERRIIARLDAERRSHLSAVAS